MQLVSKISNLCDRNPPTSQTDRRADDMQSQNRALQYSASRGKKFTPRRLLCYICTTNRMEFGLYRSL